jgi:HAMP domain-containing protein
LLFILLLVFLYFYFSNDSLVKNELKGKTTVTEAGNKIRALSCTIMEYLNRKKSYDQLNADYQALLELAENKDIFGDQEKQALTGLEGEFNTVEAIFKENAGIEKQVFELVDSYGQQSNEFFAGSGGSRQANPGITGSVSKLSQEVFNIKALFLQTRLQGENGAKLAAFLDQAGKDAENEERRLANSPFVQLPQKAKETIVKIKEIAAKFIENSKSISQSKENITNICNRLLGHIHQIEAGKTDAIVDAFKSTFFILLLVILVILFLCIILIVAVGRVITGPISAMTERAYDLAVDDVDMTKRLDVDSRDEIGELSGWFNKFLERLHLLILKVRNSSDEVFNATKDITAGSEDLAARTSELAASIPKLPRHWNNLPRPSGKIPRIQPKPT